MGRYVFGRIIQAFAVLLLLAAVVFALSRLTGNPLDIMLSMYASDEQYAAAAERLGLDKPLLTQFWTFLSGMMRGDFGESIYYRRPAMQMVLERLPATLELAFGAIVLATLIAIPFGVISAIRRDTAVDHVLKVFGVMGQSVPNFFLGIILVWLVASQVSFLPAGGRGGFGHLVLPAFTLALYILAGIMRLTRSAMLDVLDSEHIKLARAVGLQEAFVVWVYALKNALIPVVTFAGLMLAQVLVGSVVVETVFAWPGLGRLAFDAVTQRDFTLIQTVVVLFGVIYVGMNMLVDLSYALLDPRVRMGGGQ